MACTSTLKRLREAFVHPRDNTDTTTMRPADFHAHSETVERALFTFESTSNHAVVRLYRSGNISGFDSRASIASLTSENQVLAGDESENVFLVYLCAYIYNCLHPSILTSVRKATYSRCKNSRGN